MSNFNYSNYQLSSSNKELLDQFSKLPYLSSEETMNLVSIISNDRTNKEAITKLLSHNIRFIYSKAKATKLLTIDDAFSSAIEGMLKAIQSVTPSALEAISNNANNSEKEADYSKAFICYASGIIVDELRLEMKNYQSLSVTVYELRNLKKVKAAEKKVSELFGNSISNEEKIQEISVRTNLSTKVVKNCLETGTTPLSIYNPINDSSEDNLILGDTMSGEYEDSTYSEIWNSQLSRDINKILDRLSDVQRSFIEYFYGLNGKKQMSIEEISKHHGFSRQWGNKIFHTAQNALRNAEEDLESYYLLG